jgi:hypothetical protein
MHAGYSAWLKGIAFVFIASMLSGQALAQRDMPYVGSMKEEAPWIFGGERISKGKALSISGA